MYITAELLECRLFLLRVKRNFHFFIILIQSYEKTYK
jgi:hypothetical protein